MYKHMAFKGAEIVKSLCLRRLVTEEICDIISNNAAYIHFVRTIEFLYLKHFLENGIRKRWEIKQAFDKTDKKMSLLINEYERYKNFLSPMRMIRE